MISTANDLASALNIPRETQAIAAQTMDMGLKKFIRAHIIEHGETRIVGRIGGKVVNAAEAFERIFAEPLAGKKRASR